MSLSTLQNHFTQLYLAAFGRAPELSGLNYWIAEAQAKGLQATQGIIFSLPVVQTIYPATLSDAAFVEAIYQNVFGRSSDAEGMAYWSHEIATLRSGFVAQGHDAGFAAFAARGQLVMNMMTAALGTADGTPGKAFVVNRLDVATFSVETQLAQGQDIPVSLLLQNMATVNADTATPPPAKCEIGSFFDHTAPTQQASVSTLVDDAGSLQGHIADQGLTDDATPTLQGTLNAPLALCESIEVLRDGQVVGVATVNGTSWSFVDGALTDGQHTYTVRVVDMAGNAGANSGAYRLTLDTAAPQLEVASVHGDSLILNYSELLRSAALPAPADFAVQVDGQTRAVSSVHIHDDMLVLSLAQTVTQGQSVSLSYTPALTRIEDQAGNDAAAISNMSVTNTTADITPPTAPTLTLAQDTGSSGSDNLTSNGQVNVAGLETGASWEYSTNGGTNWTAGSGSSFTLTGDGLKNVIARQSDTAGNTSAQSTALNFTLDTSAPQIQTATINGSTLILGYNEGLNPASDAAIGSFTVNVNNSPIVVTGANANGNVVTLELANAVMCGQSVTLSYVPPVSTPTEDLAGNDAAAISNMSVTNTTPMPVTPLTYTPNVGTTEGSSDASTAIALDSAYMLVGDDEANVLRVYERDGGAAVLEWDYGAAFGLSGELDLEASARVGNTLVFVGSHSNKKSGNEDDNREFIFTVDVSGTGATTSFSNPQIFSGLETALVAWDNGNVHGLGAGYFGFAASSAAGAVPERVNGFSIEGAAMSQDNSQLLLGFRAPQTDTITRDTALIISFNVATQTIGTAVELDLGGRGIRSIEKAVDGSGYLILAGPAGSASSEVTHDFRLFTWSGMGTSVTELDNNLDALRDGTGGSFETIVGLSSINPGTCVQLLQDNGDTIWSGQTSASKDLAPALQQFQGNMLQLGNAVSDTTGPVLVSSSPADNAMDVARNSNIVLRFDEGVQVNASGSFVLRKSSDNSVVTTIAANDSSQISVAFNTITINPTADLDPATGYYLEVNNSAVRDHAGNAWTGLSGASALNFTTVAGALSYTLLITEVNSNATGGDFFELYNYGTSAIDLSGWKWDDDSGNFADAAAVTFPVGTSIAAGEKIVVTVGSDAAAFRAAWNNLSPSTQVIAITGPGLGREDGVVIFNAAGQVATAFNYDTTSITASDGTVITTALASAGTSFSDNQHAGTAYNGGVAVDKSSAVWDGISTANPTYKAATVGDLGAFAQTGDATSIGSPGLTSAPPVTPSLSIAVDAGSAIKDEGNSGASAFTFTVTRSGDTSTVVEADWFVHGVAPSAGSPYGEATADDFTGNALPFGHISFAAGETSKAISVNVAGDTLPELDDAFVVSLDNVVGATVTTGTVNAIINDDDLTLISTIQGSGTASPFAGNGTTYTVQGVVTAYLPGLRGFYIQEESVDSDGNTATSEGIFVYYNTTVPTGLDANSVGDIVRISGAITEYRGLTEMVNPSGFTQIVDNFGLPSAVNITLPVASLADWEAVEGMYVQVSSATAGGRLVVTDNYNLGRYGQVTLTSDSLLQQFTETNAPDVTGYTAYMTTTQLDQIVLDDGLSAQNPAVHLGRDGNPLSASNTLRGGDHAVSVTGIIDQFDVSGSLPYETPYRLQPTQTPNFSGDARPTAGDLPATITSAEIKVASVNVLNYFTTLGTTSFTNPNGTSHNGRGASDATEFTRQQDKLVANLLEPDADVIGLMEIQNNGFADGTSAIDSLVDALNAATAPGTYAYVSAPYPDGAAPDAATAGDDAIMVAFVFKPSKVTVIGKAVADPSTYDAFSATYGNRVPLAVTFQSVADGEIFTAVSNHFKSKGSVIDPNIGDGQGANNLARMEAATDLLAWLATNPTGTSDSDILLLGDFNAYSREDPLTYIDTHGFDKVSSGLSYSFDGLWGSLDHAFASDSLVSQVSGAVKWGINAEEPSVLDYNMEYKDATQDVSYYAADAYRSSDHNPVLIGLNLSSAPDVTAPVFASATVNGASLVLSYNETLDSANPPLAADFVVTVGGVARAVSAVAVSGANLTLTLATAVVNGEVVTVAYTDPTAGNDANAIQDIAGNDAATLNAVNATNTTPAADITAPTLSSSNPADEATNVSRTSDLVLTFSENMQKGTGNILIKQVSDNSVFATIDVTSAAVSVSGTQITINPATDLAAGTAYYVEMAAGVLEDLAGNDYAGLAGNGALNFTTASAPSPVLALVGINTDANDGFAFLVLSNIAAGTTFTFTDNGWQSSNTFRTGEDSLTWTPTTTVTAGTVVTWEDTVGWSSNAGSPTTSGALNGLSSSGDQILVFTGTSASPTFVYALNDEGAHTWQANATSSNTSALPLGLLNGYSAVALNELDNYRYTGATSGTVDQLLALIGDFNNWTGSDSTRQDFSSMAFTIL